MPNRITERTRVSRDSAHILLGVYDDATKLIVALLLDK